MTGTHVTISKEVPDEEKQCVEGCITLLSKESMKYFDNPISESSIRQTMSNMSIEDTILFCRYVWYLLHLLISN